LSLTLLGYFEGLTKKNGGQGTSPPRKPGTERDGGENFLQTNSLINN